MVRIIKGKSALQSVVAGRKATTGLKALSELETDGISPTYDRHAAIGSAGMGDELSQVLS